MKYSKLQTQTIQDLTEELCILKHSLNKFDGDIKAMKVVLADTLLEHERLTNRVTLCKEALFNLIDEQEKEQKRYKDLDNKLDALRFESSRDDRGESVPDLPRGPLAIVPLGISPVSPPNAEWDDEDSPHAKEVKQKIDFQECQHKRFEGPFLKYSGTYTCNNCNSSVIACFDCKEKDESNKTA